MTVPLPKGGLTLGILALGNLLIAMNVGSPDVVRAVFAGVALLLFVTIIGKCLVHPRIVLSEDMSNPVVAPVSATVFMSLMQFSTYMAPYGDGAHMLAVSLWYFAVSCNLILMVHVTSRFIVKGFALSQVFPTWFVGFVGIVVASATSSAVGQQPLGLLIFWIGFALYMVTFVLVSIRSATIEIPDAAKPSLAIYTAPMSLSIAGYTTAEAHPNVYFVLVMLICAQLLFAAVLAAMPSLLRVAFSPSYAAFTFPFVITATALLKSLNLFAAAGWRVPAWLYVLQGAEAALSCAIVLYVLILFIAHARRQWRQAGAD
jgi:exfoliative toxin A/B